MAKIVTSSSRPFIFSSTRSLLLNRSQLCRPSAALSISTGQLIRFRRNFRNDAYHSRFLKEHPIQQLNHLTHRKLCVSTTPFNDSGSSELLQSIEKKIKDQLNAESVIVKDAYGDGRHVSIYVVSAEFEGKSAVNRQRMVYKAIWEELQSAVHAVDQMVTRTPSEVPK